MSYSRFKNVEEVKNLEKLLVKTNEFRNLVSHYVKSPSLRTDIDSSMKKIYDKIDKEKFKNLKKE